MTATNHALTGALIGLAVGQPLIAVPAAVVSHFICDAIPHFDFDTDIPEKVKLKTKKFQNYLIAEAGLCTLIVILLAIFQPNHWVLAAVCAFAAASPDLLKINKYMKLRRGQPWKRSRFTKWTDDIQWFARPIGGVVEIAWFIACIALLLPFLRVT
jgi:hypothetical protein